MYMLEKEREREREREKERERGRAIYHYLHRNVQFFFLSFMNSYPFLSFPSLPFLSSFRLNSPPCSISSTLRSKVFYEYKNWIYILIQATRILFPLFLSCILPLPRFFTLALHRPFVSLSPFYQKE